mmetsp:Transcript_26001/g.65598  ORF Transcript_26001/g.65598 Transcript_26001/m.65598 type:complete len:254 (-) Transcript_26001:12-773(-)
MKTGFCPRTRRVSPFSFLCLMMRSMMGSAKPSVLPVPVRARASTSRPLKISLNVADWTGNSLVMPREASASSVSSEMGKLRTSSGSMGSSSLSSTGPGSDISSGSSLLSSESSSPSMSSSVVPVPSSRVLRSALRRPTRVGAARPGLPWGRRELPTGNLAARAPSAVRIPAGGAIPTENASAGAISAAARTVRARAAMRGRIPKQALWDPMFSLVAAALGSASPGRIGLETCGLGEGPGAVPLSVTGRKVTER